MASTIDDPRRIFDYQAKDQATLEAAQKAITSIFPIDGHTRVLRLKKLSVGQAPKHDDFEKMKETFYQGRTWGTPIHADLELVDKTTGSIIDAAKKVKIVDVPRITPFHGYLVEGKFRYLQNQLRLLPGAYSGVTGDGAFQTQVMTARGHNHKIFLDPKSSVATITPSGSSSKVKLYPVLRSLGVSQSALESAWGKDVVTANQEASKKVTETEVIKFHKTLFGKNRGYKKPDHAQAASDIHDYLRDRTEINPDTTRRMLGRAFHRVTPDLLVASTAKLLKISRGEETPDDRNSIANKGLFSVDDFLRERLISATPKIQRQMAHQMEKRDKIRQVVSSIPFTKPIRAFFNTSEMASPIKQTNPMQMIGETFKTTLMGEGGIGSIRAITEEARLLHGSHAGILDPVHTPEGDHIGVTLAVAMGAQVLPDNSLAQTLVNARTGKKELVRVKDLADKVIAFPGEVEPNKKGPTAKKTHVRVLKGFKDALLKPHKVDYVMPDAKGMFTASTNLIPFMNSVSGPRAMTGSKQVEQALALKKPEQPLVQCGIGGASKQSFERAIGSNWTATASNAGEVTGVFKNSIHVRGADGKVKIYGTFDHFPLNELSYLHSTPRVKVGDKVKQGQTLADTNFTDQGTLALGKNLHVAYLPHPSGKSYEDGIVLSESGAKKMTSVHLHRVTVKGGDGVMLSKERFTNRFPGLFSPDQLKTLDTTGLPKPGQKLRKGDPLSLRLVKEALSPEDKILQQLRRGFTPQLKNRSLHWDEDFDGEVVEVHKQGKDYTVVVKTEEPAREGDKLSGRYGNKGIVTAVFPDDQMPRTKKGQVIDMMLNPQGVLARMNTAQTHENFAAKVAKRTGDKVIHVHNFDPGSNSKKVQRLAKAYNVSDKEDLIDPKTGRTIPKVATGFNYTFKLDHQVKKKSSHHSLGPYDAEGIPLRGHEHGAQSLDLLTIYTLLAHGAKHFLKESALKGNVNQEWWRAYRNGHLPPLPRQRQSFTRFTNLLKGAGIGVVQNGSNHVLTPILDRHVNEFSNGEILKPRQVWAKNLSPEKYGLFDPEVTGGLTGTKWGHINLAEPLPHPSFEEPIRILTGFSQKEIDGLIDHSISLDRKTLEVREPRSSSGGKEGGISGGAALIAKLSSIDPQARVAELRRKLPNLKGTGLDKAHRELRYLESIIQTGISPEEYIVKTLPVLPPTMRPVYPDEKGDLRHSDLNFLYRDLMLINSGLKAIEGVPAASKKRQRRDLIDAFRALVGITSKPALIAGEERKGILHKVAGIPQPKTGYYQSKLLSRKQDISGRTTIISAPELELDEAGIPEEMAWTLFKERGIRELIQRGRSPIKAEEQWEAKDSFAKQILLDVMAKTPVVMNRAPTLHKHGVLAFWGRLRAGKALGVHPLVCRGYNADYDGDTMSIFVPVLPDAVEDAKNMLPSRNLFNPRDGQLMFTPDQEAVQGLYLLTKKPGEGRKLVEGLLPEGLRDMKRVWTKKTMQGVLERAAREHPHDFPKLVNELKNLGNKASYLMGSTLGASDLDIASPGIQKVLAKAQAAAAKISEDPKLTQTEKDDRLVELFSKADQQIMGYVTQMAPEGSQVADMVASGAKAKMDQVKQVIGAATLYESGKGGSVPVLVPTNFNDGMSPGDYWVSLYGARKGMIDKGMATAKPGELGKYTAASLLRFVVTEKDCGTEHGTRVSLTDALEAKSLLGRHLAKDANGFKAGTPLTQSHIQDLIQAGEESVEIRTPIECETPQGVCQECYGNRADTDAVPHVGENVGVIAAQSTSEPGVQLTMKAFHTAGSSSSKETAGITSQFDHINRLLTVPKKLPNSATLAEQSGKVEKVEKAPAGGTHVTVKNDDGEQTYFVSPGLDVHLKEGDTVRQGQRLSAGEVNPHELLEILGPEATKAYISRRLRELYEQGGTPVDRAHADLIARAMLDVAEVEDAGDSDEVVRGDVVPIPILKKKGKPVSTRVDRTAGRTLAKDYGELKSGTYLHAGDVKKLQGMGLKYVLVEPRPPTFKARLTGVSQLPVVGTKDWMARLGAHGLKTTLTTGAAQLYKSDTKGVHPVPALVVGSGDWSGPVPQGGKPFKGF